MSKTTRILLLFAAIGYNALTVNCKHPRQRELSLINDSGETLKIEWVNPSNGELVPYGEADATMHRTSPYILTSYVNHTFVIRSTAAPRNESSRYLTVGEQGEQKYVIQKDLKVTPMREAQHSMPFDNPVTSTEVAQTIVAKCNNRYHALDDKDKVAKAMDDLLECLKEETAAILITKNEELSFQKDLRRRIAVDAENYTCADPTKESAKPKERRTWSYEGVVRDVGILHERPASQIHIISDFISKEECESIRKAAEPTLHRGSVADGKGGSRMSDSRKAWQAGLSTEDWRDPNDPIATVKRRLFAYTNFVTGYNMTLDGQEDIMSIQYFGEGPDNKRPDRYLPHCDGDCDGLLHKMGGRVATMVMYCDVPELGGATNFQSANVFVKPKLGAAAFFSYMDQKTGIKDEGFTTHSGCPVIEGTKRIAVQWMRVGVDNENPWDSFDTNTIKLGSPL